jgi:hypothetical protein
MPLYTFSCPKCTGVYETIMSYDKMKTSEVMCKPCQVDMKRDITMPSKTASAWGDQGFVNGYYNKGLGCMVRSERHADEIAKARGLVRFQDGFNGQSYETVTDAYMDKDCLGHIQHNKDTVEVRNKMDAGADLGEAFAEVFSVERMKSDGILKEDVGG